jgi:hypothetical protein
VFHASSLPRILSISPSFSGSWKEQERKRKSFSVEKLRWS